MEVIARSLLSVEMTQFVSKQVKQILHIVVFFCIDQPDDVKKKACEKFAVSCCQLKRRRSSTLSLTNYKKLSTLGIKNEEVQV